MLGLIWVQTVCKGYQKTTEVARSMQRVVDNTFWQKPWLKLISFNLAPTVSIWLKCWLKQILSQGKPLVVNIISTSLILFPAQFCYRYMYIFIV